MLVILQHQLYLGEKLPLKIVGETDSVRDQVGFVWKRLNADQRKQLKEERERRYRCEHLRMDHETEQLIREWRIELREMRINCLGRTLRKLYKERPHSVRFTAMSEELRILLLEVLERFVDGLFR